MANRNNSWLEHPSVVKMDKRKKQILINLMEEAKGKPMNQCVSSLMKANQSLKAQGLSFDQNETATIIELLSQDMTPQEKMQYNMLQQMMGKMKK